MLVKIEKCCQKWILKLICSKNHFSKAVSTKLYRDMYTFIYMTKHFGSWQNRATNFKNIRQV